MPGLRAQQVRPIWWEDDGLTYVDQRYLPDDLVYARAMDVAAVIDAVLNSAVSGARCIDVFCAFGVVLARDSPDGEDDQSEAITQLRTAARACGYGSDALERVAAAPKGASRSRALEILDENSKIDRAIIEHTLALLPTNGAVATLGSSGALSTGGLGTAVGAISVAHRSGKAVHAYVSETRPLLSGARLAAYELRAAGVACTVFPDGAAAALMQSGPIAAVIVGATAIATNGDAVCELGTFGLALAAAHHRIPFYVAAPRAAIVADRAAATRLVDRALPVERANCATYTQRFDVTPGHLIAALITEYGVSRPPYSESLPNLATRPHFAFISHS